MEHRASRRPLRSRLREVRAAAGLTQQELADAAGVTRQALGLLEAERSAPKTEVALRLARALECRVEDLFTLDLEPPLRHPIQIWGTGGYDANRVMVARVRGRLVGHPLHGPTACNEGFASADGFLPRGESRGSARLITDPDRIDRTALLVGCDPALSLLCAHVARQRRDAHLRWHPLSSSSAIEAAVGGGAHIAGTHLGDPMAAGMVDRASRALGPRGGLLIAFARWEQGFIVAAGNPKKIRSVNDLVRPGVRLINRDRGSGTRRALEDLLSRFSIQPSAIVGHDREVRTHFAVARMIVAGGADVGIGSRAIAAVHGLDFVPLEEVRFDLLIPSDHLDHPAVQAMLETLSSAALREELSCLDGYDPTDIGKTVASVPARGAQER